MKCWHCNEEVIWGGDFDYEDYGLEGEGIVSNLKGLNLVSIAAEQILNNQTIKARNIVSSFLSI